MAAALPSCPSHFRTTRAVSHPISRFGGKMSYHLVNRDFEPWIRQNLVNNWYVVCESSHRGLHWGTIIPNRRLGRNWRAPGPVSRLDATLQWNVEMYHTQLNELLHIIADRITRFRGLRLKKAKASGNFITWHTMLKSSHSVNVNYTRLQTKRGPLWNIKQKKTTKKKTCINSYSRIRWDVFHQISRRRVHAYIPERGDLSSRSRKWL